MKRSSFALFLTLIAVALLATSCDTLFTNQFKVLGLGQVASNTLSNAVTNGDTGTIIAESGIDTGAISDSFITAVTSSTETTKAVLDQLQTTVDNPATPPATVEAAEVLIVQIQLEASGAKTMIDNIVAAISTFDFTPANFNINNPQNLSDLLAALFPARSGRLTLPAGWTAGEVGTIIDTLVSLDDDLAALIAGMVGGQYINSGVDAGWLAQVGTFIRVLKRLSPVNPAETLGTAIARLITDFNIAAPLLTNPLLYINVPADLVNDLKVDVRLNALFAAAGMNLTDLLAGFGL